MVAAVAPVADFARKLRRVFVQGVFFMSEEVVGEGFSQKVGFSQKTWQALFVPNPNFPTFTSPFLRFFGNSTQFILTKLEELLA